MLRYLTSLLLASALLADKPATAANYGIQKVAEGVYAALVLPNSKAASNALIIVGSHQVILAGAHFVPEGIKELTEEIARITPLPLRQVILTHHHRGSNYVDFDLPGNVEVVTSWQTWQALKSESREFRNRVLFFDNSLTFQWGKLTIILNNTDAGHSAGDVFLYLPNEGILFTSDLFFNDVVGYMGDGEMREWVINLEMLEGLDARIVVPGLGAVTDSAGIRRFRLFFKDFLTELLRHLEKGETLLQTKKNFRLPQHSDLPGYKAFFDINVERAYNELKAR